MLRGEECRTKFCPYELNVKLELLLIEFDALLEKERVISSTLR